MKLPKKIRISYADYPVSAMQLPHILGDIQYNPKSIQLHNTLEVDTEAEVLLHEILHGVYYHKSLDIGDCEERVVNSLADGLIQVFKDNKGLFDYFKDRLDV